MKNKNRVTRFVPRVSRVNYNENGHVSDTVGFLVFISSSYIHKPNFLLILTLLLLLCKANAFEHMRDSHISSYNGNNALHHYRATTKEIPYHVLIVYHNLYCSGALVLSRVVVTAASCFVKWKNQRIVVKVGSDTLTNIG